MQRLQLLKPAAQSCFLKCLVLTPTFTLDTAAISFAYDGTSANRDTIAQSISTLNALGGDTYSVVNANGRVEITNQSNSAMALSAFTSTGSGKIVASTVAEDAGAQGVSEILDDTVAAVTAAQLQPARLQQPGWICHLLQMTPTPSKSLMG